MDTQQQNSDVPGDAVRKVAIVGPVILDVTHKTVIDKRQHERMDQQQHERYVRWQDYRIRHLSFTINLFLTFAVASLAYAINLKLENKQHGSIPLETIIIWWAVSAAFGVIATMSRLLDFRCTEKKNKNNDKLSNSVISKCCGKITWKCFEYQAIAYFLGACWFIAGILRL